MRVGLLLAAGLSRRFGGDDKLLALFRGQALVSHAAAVMAQLSLDRRLAVVSSGEVERHLAGFDLVRNPAPENGQGVSLALGAAAAERLGATRLLVMLADMPLITSDHCQSVLERCTDERSSASSDGAHSMPPVCLSAKDLKRFVQHQGDSGARGFIAGLPQDALVHVGSHILADIDTRKMLENWR